MMECINLPMVTLNNFTGNKLHYTSLWLLAKKKKPKNPQLLVNLFAITHGTTAQVTTEKETFNRAT